ncbi:ABC-2 type transport system ATP-binding protein [Herbihabitans rhizosphaerae]|uniref:ABC-2 type transport system ATP-binding protein n=1 Tax=Herbihabitans rhizosphaerae TaxID=1872711 RepID=A0A4Q7KCT8_9PSEU|nr:ATP-binding cassette domain-containing protein [Herbihabitans rhizosphaerae]RZS31125.1 ABC-2 type transport system ATP-binding protein [Herbihabitans rhizosphaerae]
MTELMIEAEHVRKVFGDVVALDDVSLRVPKGTVMGLLGHNGAGKTTLVNVLTTVLPAESGRASVAGNDLTTAPDKVRSSIGVTGQFASVDELLTGRQNLILVARLLGASPGQARERASDLLELFDLADAADRKASTYSGGMKRRLDLATSLLGHPEVVFLDEPTTGLDPTSRVSLWEIVERLVDDGTTVLLTTQYMEEADRLADSITVLSNGSVVAAGTAAELKADVGQRTVAVTLTGESDPAAALESLRRKGLRPMNEKPQRALTIPVGAASDVAVVVRALDDVDAEVSELNVHEPTLDDVYLALTRTKTAA